MENKIYDIIIIGAGPGGLTAAIYALRSGREVLIIEKAMPGGQIALTGFVENYPGFAKIEGFELSQNMLNQATSLGAEIKYAEVEKVELNGKTKTIYTNDGQVQSKAIIISTGARSRKLNVDGENKYSGSGVAYCAICDGAFYKDQDVVVVGGGNSAVEDAVYLSKIAKTVYLVVRGDQLKAEKITVDELHEINARQNNVNIYYNSIVTNITGDNVVRNVEIQNTTNNTTKTLSTSGVFIAIGRIPETELFKDIISLNEWNYILTDDKMQTNVAGVFAVGDVREKTVRQIVTATADGAIAATYADSYLNSIK